MINIEGYFLNLYFDSFIYIDDYMRWILKINATCIYIHMMSICIG